MSTHLERSQGPESLPNGALLDLLRALEEEERELSNRRQALHEQIDNVRVRRDDEPELDVDLLDALQRDERDLSEGRLQLHLKIAQLRIERGNRLRGLRAHLSAVE